MTIFHKGGAMLASQENVIFLPSADLPRHRDPFAAALCAALQASDGKPHPDTELLSLFEKFKALLREAEPLNELANESSDKWHSVMDGYGWEACCEWARANGHNENVEAVDAVHKRIDAVMAKMFAIRPKTFVGLAAIADALRLFDIEHYWREPEPERDWDIRQVTMFMELVMDLGVDQNREAANV